MDAAVGQVQLDGILVQRLNALERKLFDFHQFSVVFKLM